ncbi:hypothetical protein [Rosistilla carotiformis]|uniref:hypothetical protein n=1 Tax=Rosistilla carotiformis TaxID=2528017 RepID=UPI0011A7443B|nr:hypothetical protein [Rosistilla carotiformis]
MYSVTGAAKPSDVHRIEKVTTSFTPLVWQRLGWPRAPSFTFGTAVDGYRIPAATSVVREVVVSLINGFREWASARGISLIDGNQAMVERGERWCIKAQRVLAN